MRLIFAAITLLATVAPASAQNENGRGPANAGIQQTIRRLDDERIQAQIHADAPALDRLYADDFIGVGPSGTIRSKRQVIADFTSGTLKFQSITTDEVQVRVYGSTAVETGRSTIKGEDKGKVVPQDTRFTRVWVKQHGRCGWLPITIPARYRSYNRRSASRQWQLWRARRD